MDLAYEHAIANAAHYLAIGQDNIWIKEATAPWALADDVKSGSSFRFNGPTNARFSFTHDSGLTITWTVDYERVEANGKSYSLFDRDRLRDVMLKLSPDTRRKFGMLLRNDVLRGLAERTEEYRAAMRQQADSEDCVRGLIAFALEVESK